jgi:hypothetical protein
MQPQIWSRGGARRACFPLPWPYSTKELRGLELKCVELVIGHRNCTAMESSLSYSTYVGRCYVVLDWTPGTGREIFSCGSTNLLRRCPSFNVQRGPARGVGLQIKNHLPGDCDIEIMTGRAAGRNTATQLVERRKKSHSIPASPSDGGSLHPLIGGFAPLAGSSPHYANSLGRPVSSTSLALAGDAGSYWLGWIQSAELPDVRCSRYDGACWPGIERQAADTHDDTCRAREVISSWTRPLVIWNNLSYYYFGAFARRCYRRVTVPGHLGRYLDSVELCSPRCTLGQHHPRVLDCDKFCSVALNQRISEKSWASLGNWLHVGLGENRTCLPGPSILGLAIYDLAKFPPTICQMLRS